MSEVQQKWDTVYNNIAETPPPAEVVSANQHLLPTQGTALDVACGLGANAMLLARRGLMTTAWDISAVAVERLNQAAQKMELQLHAAVRDIPRQPPPSQSYDVIVCCHYLERPLLPILCSALKPEGLLFFQTFTLEKVDPTIGPSNPEWLLQPNELLRAFAELRVRVYREEGLLGDLKRGYRNRAMLVAQKM